jgi:hypothetical protein
LPVGFLSAAINAGRNLNDSAQNPALSAGCNRTIFRQSQLSFATREPCLGMFVVLKGHVSIGQRDGRGHVAEPAKNNSPDWRRTAMSTLNERWQRMNRQLDDGEKWLANPVLIERIEAGLPPAPDQTICDPTAAWSCPAHTHERPRVEWRDEPTLLA